MWRACFNSAILYNVLTIFFAILGLVYGSFLNMLLWRLPRGESIGGRSQCISCNYQLAWYDLIPVLSFIFLRGQCRSCAQRIPPRYLFVELGSCLLFGLLGWWVAPGLTTLSLVATSVFLGLFYGLFCFDLMFFILPDVFTLSGAVLAVVYAFFVLPSWPSFVLTSLVSALLFGILYVVSHGRWLGLGDVKLILFIGLVFGYPMTYFIVVGSVWAGALVGLGLIATKKATMKKALPFGAFLTAVSILSIFVSSHLTFLETFFR